jgi:hypothetical protein
MEGYMPDETNETTHVHHHENCGKKNGNLAGGIYGMAFIGAAIYYLTHAATFWMGVFGFFKAIFWPAFLIYQLLEFLKM